VKDISTTVKLSATIVLLAILTAAVTGFIANTKATNALDTEVSSRLSALAEARKTAVSTYLASIRTDLVSLADNEGLIAAMKRFSAAKRGLGDEVQKTLQKAYITDNPHPKGERHKLTQIDTRMAYAYGHQKFHPWLSKYALDRGYHDLFLIDPDGDVVYSVFKNDEFATNLENGAFKSSGLAGAFRRAMAIRQPGTVSFADYAGYAPAAGAPASFIAVPILAEGKPIGVLAYRMPIDQINAIMESATGLGKTGETYLVGSDLMMRSDTRLSADSTILKTKVDTQPVKNALAGKSGLLVGDDYLGRRVYAAYGAINFEGVPLAIVAEIGADEIARPVAEINWFLLVTSVVIVIAVSAVGVWFSRSLTAPIVRMTGVMASLAEGDLDVPVPDQGRKDEIGKMADAVQVFKVNALRVREMEEEQAVAERDAAEQKRQATRELADGFESSVGHIVETVSTAAGEMASTSKTLLTSAEQTSALSSEVTQAAEETFANVEAVSAAAEQLSASISEISRQVAQSSGISRTAVSEVEDTNARIQGLADAAEKIGAIVHLISDIAEQTNLLALNATIEAARAGDVGKGFAVVASEVKSLADQTARATSDISSQVIAVQSATREAVTSISTIVDVINRINEIAGAVAAAVEEQGAATSEIARNAEQAASGVATVTTNLGSVSRMAADTGDHARQMGDATAQLFREAETLSGEVGRFLQEVRAS